MFHLHCIFDHFYSLLHPILTLKLIRNRIACLSMKKGIRLCSATCTDCQCCKVLMQNTKCSLVWIPPSPSNKCPGCGTKQSDCEAPIILELWGMWSTGGRIRGFPSFSLLPGSFWPSVVTPNRVLSRGQIELIDTETILKTFKLCAKNELSLI